MQIADYGVNLYNKSGSAGGLGPRSFRARASSVETSEGTRVLHSLMRSMLLSTPRTQGGAGGHSWAVAVGSVHIHAGGLPAAGCSGRRALLKLPTLLTR